MVHTHAHTHIHTDLVRFQITQSSTLVIVVPRKVLRVVRRKKNLKKIGVEGKCELEEKGGERRESEMEGRVRWREDLDGGKI